LLVGVDFEFISPIVDKVVEITGLLCLYAVGVLGGPLFLLLLLLLMVFVLYLVMLDILLICDKLDMLDLYDLHDIAEMDLLSDLLTETDFSERLQLSARV
jgi:hypothetical protein